MARIAGIDLPKNKKAKVGLTYIFGIGRTTAEKILAETDVDKEKRIKNLSDGEVKKIRDYIDQNETVEGALRTERKLAIKRLMEIGCYRGERHKKGLPVNGQRTRTNARTRKGKKKISGRG